jgi:hypothetical protein
VFSKREESSNFSTTVTTNLTVSWQKYMNIFSGVSQSESIERNGLIWRCTHEKDQIKMFKYEAIRLSGEAHDPPQSATRPVCTAERLRSWPLHPVTRFLLALDARLRWPSREARTGVEGEKANYTFGTLPSLGGRQNYTVTHPFFEWDSNPRSQCLKGTKPCTLKTSRSLWSAALFFLFINHWKSPHSMSVLMLQKIITRMTHRTTKLVGAGDELKIH